MILLYPNHHTIIDNDTDSFPVEKLHLIKTNHELWVEQTLSSQLQDPKKQAEDLIYAGIVDAAVQYCHLPEWQSWTNGALEPIPLWPLELPSDFLKFRQKVASADFPGTLTELERAARTLSILLHEAAQEFQKHCEIKEGSDGHLFYRAVQFYKTSWDPARYDKLLREFEEWIEECHRLIMEAAKAANWFREVVRKEVNPMFFVTEGKFMTTYPWSGDGGLSHQFLLLEYKQEEKDRLPDSLLSATD